MLRISTKEFKKEYNQRTKNSEIDSEFNIQNSKKKIAYPFSNAKKFENSFTKNCIC